jgi:hypothetical protein
VNLRWLDDRIGALHAEDDPEGLVLRIIGVRLPVSVQRRRGANNSRVALSLELFVILKLGASGVGGEALRGIVEIGALAGRRA